jgi:fumarylacetoacetase
VPIGYHGRASSIVISGQSFRRPLGQTRAESTLPPEGVARISAPAAARLRLELGIVIAAAQLLGVRPCRSRWPKTMWFGLTLFNDWSARDVQGWEYQPLGPFLSKNFASTVSPWMVTLEALAPFRQPFEGPRGDPAPLPYLDSAANRDQGRDRHPARSLAADGRDARGPAMTATASRARTTPMPTDHRAAGGAPQPSTAATCSRGDLLGSAR